MSYRSSLFLIPALSFVLSVSAMADITLNNGADINMTGSPGSTIIFPDGTIQSTATVADPAGADGSDGAPGSDGADGADGADGSDAAVPTGHGGTGNIVSGTDSFVGGGYANIASHDYATVAGGAINAASDDRATVGGGVGNTASGSRSTVAGGGGNRAAGDYSFAAGYRAKIAAAHDGTFMFADSSIAADFHSAAADEFAVRSTGGVRFVTGVDVSGVPTAGVVLASGAGAWSPLSARAAKENFTPVDVIAVLEKVASMPVEEWNYKAQEDSIRHIGPMAEDFRAAFGVGDFVGRITSTDADGVALAAIQGLNQKLEANLEETRGELDEKQAEIDRLEAELAKHDEQFASLEQRLLAMEASMN